MLTALRKALATFLAVGAVIVAVPAANSGNWGTVATMVVVGAVCVWATRSP